MQITLHERVGSGGFGDVYRATDDLDRTVAAKLLSLSAEQMVSLREHALGLIRVNHPNVVQVHGIETVTDPRTGDKVQALIMEFIEGVDLRDRAAGEPMGVEELRRVGAGIIDGVEALHSAGVAHQDLHEKNVMVTPAGAKLIDVFYRGSLALLSNTSREARLAKDLKDLRDVLAYGIRYSILGAAVADGFDSAAAVASNFSAIRAAFEAAIKGPESAELHKKRVEAAYTRVTEKGFVAKEKYGKALAEQTPREVDADLLTMMVTTHAARPEHFHFIRAIWARMGTLDRATVAAVLADVIDREVPDGRYAPPLYCLFAFGQSGWEALRVTTQMRLEKLILEDIQLGRKNSRANEVYLRGKLGTFALYFWSAFDRDDLVNVVVSQLSANWFTQNYIAEHFMDLLPRFGERAPHREKLIQALRRAVDNGADDVVKNLTKLPDEWRREIEVDTTFDDIDF
jgi:tRNA A-37 threonylcarbamoyl transferase component Bud32